MLTRYPEIKPYATHRLATEEPHEIYVEESGTPTGIPVLFVHGGPGAGCSAHHRCYFDPARYRIILFDQRGAGQSLPHAELRNNHSQGLVQDMDLIRRHLAIERWLVFGGSWGATLSLLYAQQYPQRVLGMILRGIFLGREQDVRWLYEAGGASRLFPDHWADFMRPLGEPTPLNCVATYHELLTGDNELARMAAAKAWATWEAQCATLRPNVKRLQDSVRPHIALALARIEAHYIVNRCFLDENQLIDNASRLAAIPGIIVHGRYDMVCPLDNAYTLHRHWPKAKLIIVRDAGHAASEPGTTDALVRATRQMAERFAAQP